jgi:hypothetical protein
MEFGNLMSYGPDLDELFRHSTKYGSNNRAYCCAA